MTVKEYVVAVVENSAKFREINVGEEVWNILYNLLHDFNIKHSDQYEKDNEFLRGYVESREIEFCNHYPHRKKAL